MTDAPAEEERADHRPIPPDLEGMDADTIAGAGRDFTEHEPRIRMHAKIKSSHIRDPGTLDDTVQNAVGNAWREWLSALRHGKDPNAFPTVIATMGARHAAAHRGPCGRERTRDVLSPLAKILHGVQVEQLDGALRRCLADSDGDPHAQEDLDAAEAPLLDRSATPPDVKARLGWYDLPAWLESLKPRHRGVAEALMAGYEGAEIAQLLGVDPSRIPQLKRELAASWKRFHQCQQERSR